MTQTLQLYRSIDEYLGPADTRFFGCGYRRADHQVADIHITPSGERPATRAQVTVSYPADWSTKATRTDLRPHLSTVDVLVLGVQLSEAHLSHTFGLKVDQRRAMRLRKVTIRAGGAPQEELSALPASAVLISSSADPAAAGGFVSVLDCSVGAMRARCEIEHPVAAEVISQRACASLDPLLGPAATRYFGDGFRSRSQHITDVSADIAALRARAIVHLATAPGAPAPWGGIEGRYQPQLSVIDSFVANLQLVQILLYEMDAVARQDSNTLWMVKTVLQATDLTRPWKQPAQAEVAITGKHLVQLRGGTWRNVDITAACGGVSLRCSFAHELPPGAIPSERAPGQADSKQDG